MLLSARSIASLLIALTLVVSSLGRIVHGADMVVDLAAAGDAIDAPMADGCSGCDGGDEMAVACSVMCGSAAFAIVPEMPTLSLAVSSEPALVLTPLRIGQRSSPDPYPPRPFSMI